MKARAVIVNLSPGVPANVEEALSGTDKDKWRMAFKEELNSLYANGTWEAPAPVPKGRKILPGRWVLTHKLDA